jgi:hypothetical protein
MFRMAQSRGIPLREGDSISVSWPEIKKKPNTSNAQQTGARQYTGAGSPYISKLFKQRLIDIYIH